MILGGDTNIVIGDTNQTALEFRRELLEIEVIVTCYATIMTSNTNESY